MVAAGKDIFSWTSSASFFFMISLGEERTTVAAGVVMYI